MDFGFSIGISHSFSQTLVSTVIDTLYKFNQERNTLWYFTSFNLKKWRERNNRGLSIQSFYSYLCASSKDFFFFSTADSVCGRGEVIGGEESWKKLHWLTFFKKY